MSQIESFDDSHAITLIGTGPGVSSRVLRLGEVIGGSYKLKVLLGKGGMGYVFCAEQIMIKRDCALKILAPEQLNEATRRRFEIEGMAIANLDHANIVKVYDIGLDAGDCPFYVMDLLGGRALSDYIDRKQAMALDECLDIFIQIASGLGYAHSKGIVHRDVKPSNIILIEGRGKRWHVKIVDFGIAKILPSATLHSQSHTATGAVFGSPLYMSPEQCMGHAVDHRSDIYSLGCTLFEVLSGLPPFCGLNAMETVLMHQSEPIPSILEAVPDKQLPQSVELLLTKMLAKRPEDRYQSMEQLTHDLERVKQGKTIGRAPGPGAPATDGKYIGRSPSPSGSVPMEAHKDSDRKRGIADNRLTLFLMLGVLALLVGGGALWALNLFQNHGQQSFGKKDSVESCFEIDEYKPHRDLKLEEAWDAYKKCGRIKSTIVTIDGIKQKKFAFPAISVGLISADGFGPTKASGIVYAPADKPLRLEIGSGMSRAVLYSPAIVGKIDAGEFSGLGIAGKGLTDITGQFSGLGKPSEQVLYMLKAAHDWPNLEWLRLESVPVTRQALDVINDCKHLRCLEIDKPMTNSKDLPNQPFISRLRILRLNGIEQIDSVCDKLANSPNIETVRFTECNITPQALLKLAACPHLYRLELQEANFAQLVPTVTRLAALQEVRFTDASLNQEQIKSITACKNIRRLLLSRDAFSEEARRSCNDPKVYFDTD